MQEYNYSERSKQSITPMKVKERRLVSKASQTNAYKQTETELNEAKKFNKSNIEKGKVQHLFVGLFGDPKSETNHSIIRRAERMAQARKKLGSLSISFFDSQSARVWG